MLRKKAMVGIVISLLTLISPTIAFGLERAAVLRFACIGDPHYGWGDIQYAREIVDVWNYDPNFPKLDFAVNLGDFVSGDRLISVDQLRAVWKQALLESFGQAMMPWFFTPGNHDVELGQVGVEAKEALELIQAETGVMGLGSVFKINNILFLLYRWKGNGLSEEIKEWLELMTKLYKNVTTIIISHAGPTVDDEWWHDFLLKNPQIKLLIHGHSHFFREYAIGDAVVVDCGITNYQGLPWTYYFEVQPHGILVGVYDAKAKAWVKQPFFVKEFLTGVTNAGFEWYGVTWHVHNGQRFSFFNHMLAKDYEVELCGSRLLWDPNLADYVLGGSAAEDLKVLLNGKNLEVAGPLSLETPVSFHLQDELMQNELHWDVCVGGSGAAMLTLLYKEPVLWSPNMSIGVLEREGNALLCSFLPTSMLMQEGRVYPVALGEVIVEGADLTVAKEWYRVWTIEGKRVSKVFVAPAQPPEVLIELLELPTQVAVGESFEVKIRVQNKGNRAPLEFSVCVDDIATKSTYVYLGPNEVTEIIFSLTIYTPGVHKICINQLAEGKVEVIEALPF